MHIGVVSTDNYLSVVKAKNEFSMKIHQLLLVNVDFEQFQLHVANTKSAKKLSR